MTINEIFSENGARLITDIQNNMAAAGQNATGETARSLRFHVEQSGRRYKFTLFGRPYFFTVETGRRPTPSKKPSREMIDRITAWTRSRGITLDAVWAIATKIQQEGTKLWQEGGRQDIIRPATDKFINETTNKILENEAQEFRIKIGEMKWQ